VHELGISGDIGIGLDKQQHSDICPKFHITIKDRHFIECKAYHWETYVFFKRHFHGGRKNTQSATAAFAQYNSALILNVNVVMKQEIVKKARNNCQQNYDVSSKKLAVEINRYYDLILVRKRHTILNKNLKKIDN